MNRKNFLIFLIVTVFISALMASGVTYFILSREDHKVIHETSSSPSNVSTPVNFTAHVSGDSNPASFTDFTYASERSIHAVVHVKTVSYVQERYLSNPFEFFFGTPFFNSQPRQQIGMGSGVIISPDGYIVTNNHVISGASGIEVTLNNKQTFSATVIGADPATDIALIKIDADKLSFIDFGNSDELKVGEWVLAVGNPFNLTSTVTAGIVSAKGRNLGIISGSMGIESFIQTDAAVNAGNSGGALVNIRGELVGINTAIASPTGNFSGYSFAVPVSIAKKVVEDLMQYGTVQRALLTGVEMVDLDAESAKKYDIKTNDYRGVLVTAVTSGTSSAKAGLQAGDIIVKVNGVEIETLSILQEQINRYRPSDKVKITVLRGKKEKELEIVLNNKNGGLELLSTDDELTGALGATFKELTFEEKKQWDIDYGIQVSEVGTGTFQESGIRKSYIIIRVNKTPINSVETLRSVVEKARGALLIEGFYPNGQVVYYSIRI